MASGRAGVFSSLYLLFLVNAHATSPYSAINHEITEKNLKSHVSFLSSDALEGRLTGSAGEKLATEYIANIFRRLGLEPAGDNGTFFQTFNFTAESSLGKNNAFSITNSKGITQQFKSGEAWRPLSFSDNASFESTELVFAGYGITVPASGNTSTYDSYRGLNVKNKWVVVFRYAPEKISSARLHELNRYASLRYKTFTAKTQGAKGIIFVSGPNSRVKNELIPFSVNTSLSGAGIVALSVKDNVIDELLKDSMTSLQTLQDALDLEQLCSLPVIRDIKFVGQTDIIKTMRQGRNVLAKLKFGSSTAPMILVGAHVDHLGRGELGASRARDNELGMIHSGADDNASGVASVLEVAARFSNLKAQGKLQGNKDILFAAWSGEEFGILGSSHFVTQLMKKQSLRSAIDVAVNLDMVGHLNESLMLQGVGSSSEWPKMIDQIKAKHAVSIIMQNDPYLPTDSTAFYLQGVPGLNFFSGGHDDYHSPRDKADTLNYEGVKHISDILADLIMALGAKRDLLSYNAIEKTRDDVEREFKIYLGTIPDYANADVSGVRLSGVAKNSPAEQAGLQHNDVIIELAGKNINDIYDYTFVLNTLHVGTPAKLVVLRGQKHVALMIVAQYRE